MPEAQSHVRRDFLIASRTKDPECGGSQRRVPPSAPRAGIPQLRSREHVVGGQGEVRAWGGSQFLFYLLVEQDVVLRTHAKALPDSIQAGFNVLSPNEHSPGCRWQQTSQDGPAERRSQWLKGWPLGRPWDSSLHPRVGDSAPQLNPNHHQLQEPTVSCMGLRTSVYVQAPRRMSTSAFLLCFTYFLVLSGKH